MIRVALLWHMHQPFYKDPGSGEYRLPWARLHALKDYYGMVKLAEEFPSLRLTFNLVPSLIVQVNDYAQGKARDPFLEIARMPVENLDAAERRFLLRYFFMANYQTMIPRFPRYRELLEKYRHGRWDGDRAVAAFSHAELRDLQVLYQLVWLDEYFLREEPARTLVQKGRDFSAQDQAAICTIQPAWIARIVPQYRSAAERGQIEISTSPFYHPILPLVSDTNVASAARADVHLPRERFHYPQDARTQLERARQFHQEQFGRAPDGVWPSEGSVSDEVLRMAAELGFCWTATDEGVLGRSLNRPFARDPQGAVDRPEDLYTAYRLDRDGRPIHVFFRDHQLSDLIGFVYSQMEAEKAAEDFVQRLRISARPLTAKGQDALVTVILDGENAWEYFPDNGRPFLRALYRKLTASRDLATCTFCEALAVAQPKPLPALVPGSWINANFDIWIGAEEDNRAWDQLAAARIAYEQARSRPLTPEKLDAAYENLLIAEGSDWNWWYGPEHHSDNEPEFDALYRSYLSSVYLNLGRTPPGSLLQPITQTVKGPVYFEAASGWIHPRIDGLISSYFEWIGAASYYADRRTSTMHGKHFSLAGLRVGYDDQCLYMRVDFIRAAEEFSGELRFEMAGERTCALITHIESGVLTGVTFDPPPGDPPAGDSTDGSAAPSLQYKVALKKILEIGVPRSLLAAAGEGARVSLRLTYWADGLPRETLPSEGSVEVVFQTQEALAASV